MSSWEEEEEEPKYWNEFKNKVNDLAKRSDAETHEEFINELRLRKYPTSALPNTPLSLYYSVEGHA